MDHSSRVIVNPLIDGVRPPVTKTGNPLLDAPKNNDSTGDNFYATGMRVAQVGTNTANALLNAPKNNSNTGDFFYSTGMRVAEVGTKTGNALLDAAKNNSHTGDYFYAGGVGTTGTTGSAGSNGAQGKNMAYKKPVYKGIPPPYSNVDMRSFRSFMSVEGGTATPQNAPTVSTTEFDSPSMSLQSITQPVSVSEPTKFSVASMLIPVALVAGILGVIYFSKNLKIA